MRRLIATALIDVAPAFVQQTIVLAAELVGNAVQHGRTTFTTRLTYGDDVVRVTVIDRGGGRPEVLPQTPDRIAGVGLHVVANGADRWGSECAHGVTTVWFELSHATIPTQESLTAAV